MSHPKQPILFPAFFGFIIIFEMQMCFFCLFLCSFSGFCAATLFETVTAKEQEQKQVELCLDWFWI
ncbi:hypothetical protein CBFG_01599 [Clostridiales bacterium 1_7_47FAA]|nr:hypothetical protein CBFG_01599 [Clostridiales bacterium 1_7_47FAA]